MPELLESPPFVNPVSQALHGPHQHLGHFADLACRYQPTVSAFAVLARSAPDAFVQLASLLAPGEAIWIIDPTPPLTDQLTSIKLLPGLQMLLPAHTVPPEPKHAIAPLAADDLPEMLALIELAFPGFFLPGTPRMGAWFGIRVAGTLVAMAGERFLPEGWPEISGLCTHSDHRGRGYAASLLTHLTRRHRARGLRSWLEVGTANTRAVALYRQLGFCVFAEVTFQQLRRLP